MTPETAEISTSLGREGGDDDNGDDDDDDRVIYQLRFPKIRSLFVAFQSMYGAHKDHRSVPHHLMLQKYLTTSENQFQGFIKLAVKRFEGESSRQKAYTKRKDKIVRKGQELMTLCESDLALLMFSPDGQLTSCGSNGRIEDTFLRFLGEADEYKRGYEACPSNIPCPCTSTYSIVKGEVVWRTEYCARQTLKAKRYIFGIRT